MKTDRVASVPSWPERRAQLLAQCSRAIGDTVTDGLTADEWVNIAVEVLDQTKAERALEDLGDLFDECLDELRAQATDRYLEGR